MTREALCEGSQTLCEEAQDDVVLRDMFSRANQNKFRAWAAENGATEDDLSTADGVLHEFAYWLEQEHSVRVENGMVEFWRLDNPSTVRMIGDNPVLLYHFTSSLRVPSIRRDGLVSGRRSVNRTETEGVYLTTETSGPAITGYIRNAVRGSKRAYGVRIDVRTFLHDIQPDQDDADIRSGATQFVTDYVAPSQIVAIERASY